MFAVVWVGLSGTLMYACPVTGNTSSSVSVSKLTAPFTVAPDAIVTGVVTEGSKEIDSMPVAAAAGCNGIPSTIKNASRCRSGIRFAR